MRIIKKGATSQSIDIEILDSTSTTGARKTGLAYNTSGLTAYYRRVGGSATAITLATQTASGAWSSGGFAEIDATNMPGVYRLDLPDAAVASGADAVTVTLKGATGMAQVSMTIQLVAIDLQDATRLGLSAIPNAAAGASGGLPTAIDGSGRVDVGKINSVATTSVTAVGANIGSSQALTFDANNLLKVDVEDWKGAVAAAMTGDAYARLGVPAGASVSADIAAVKTDVDALPSATTTAGAVWDVTMASHLTSGTTGAALNAAGAAGDPWSTTLPGAYGAGTAGYIIGHNIDAQVSTRLATSGYTAPDNSDIATVLSDLTSGTLTIYGQVGAIKAKTDNLPASPAATSDIPSAATVAGAVWDVTLSSHLTAGTTGHALNASGSAGDPWSTALPGSYGAGTAGYVLGHNLDALVSSRAAPGDAMTLTSGERTSVADTLLDRNMATGADSSSSSVRTVRSALRTNRNKVVISGTTLTVYKEDDTTVAYTATLTTDSSAVPITSVDPN